MTGAAAKTRLSPVAEALAYAIPYYDGPDRVWGGVLDVIGPAHLVVLPAELAGAAPVFRGDPPRLRLAADIAVAYDLHETAGAIAEEAAATGDKRLLIAAAALAGHPAAPDAVRDRLLGLAPGDRRVAIRLSSREQPADDSEMLLRSQAWPGARVAGSGLSGTPVVVLDDEIGAGVWRLAHSIRTRTGAAVRRLSAEHDIPLWFGDETVAVCRRRLAKKLALARPAVAGAVLPADDRLRPEGGLFNRIAAAVAGIRAGRPYPERC